MSSLANFLGTDSSFFEPLASITFDLKSQIDQNMIILQTEGEGNRNLNILYLFHGAGGSEIHRFDEIAHIQRL